MNDISNSYRQVLSDFRIYMKLERNMSENTVTSYLSDCEKLCIFLEDAGIDEPCNITSESLEDFIGSLQKDGISKRSQARTISSIRTFFKYLETERINNNHPQDRIDSPKINKYLPVVLSVEEVFSVIESVDLSKPEGHRNRAILETLYSCGLRVSEVISLKISDLFFDEQFIRIIGKGNKQRLVPIGEPAIKQILYYMEDRKHIVPAKDCDDILFLNRRGGKLSRVMVFNIVKAQAGAAGITKEISPHTFRHSFATHMIENGADIRVVQEMLGHESILTTEIYTHVNSSKWQESVLVHHPLSGTAAESTTGESAATAE